MKTGDHQVKIAVPTNDGLSISDHFGRSAAFLIFETENAQVKSRELKENVAKHDHASSCAGDGGGSAQPHDCGAMLSALAGCDVVICAGMGWRAAEALKQSGVGEVIVTGPGPVDEAVRAYLDGKLSGGRSFCQCSH
jgi:predicted Fe-Mo cluster-binding NifX family protein